MDTARALTIALAVLAASTVAHADPRTDAPESPGRAEVQGAMHAITPAIRACGRDGMVTVTFEFGPDGRVRSATVRGAVGGAPLAGSDAERCIVAAARTAVLPIFRRERFVVNYPFRL